MRVDGLIAAGVFDGSIDTASFTAWVEQVLVPTLRSGEIVILDVLSFHQSLAAGRAIEAEGAHLWFLPKYRPDFNPVGLCFAKLKAIPRADRGQPVDAIWQRIGQCVPKFSAAECQRNFRHYGYSAATVRQ